MKRKFQKRMTEEPAITISNIQFPGKEPMDWKDSENKPVFITSEYVPVFFSYLAYRRLEKFSECVLKSKGRGNFYRLVHTC